RSADAGCGGPRCWDRRYQPEYNFEMAPRTPEGFHIKAEGRAAHPGDRTFIYSETPEGFHSHGLIVPKVSGTVFDPEKPQPSGCQLCNPFGVEIWWGRTVPRVRFATLGYDIEPLRGSGNVRPWCAQI